MRAPAALVGLLAASALLSGCVVAALPIAAGAVIGRGELKKRRERSAEAFAPTAVAAASRKAALPGVTITPLRTLPRPDGAPAATADVPTPPAGGGEIAAQSFQVFIALRNHMAATARLRTLNVEPDAVVLTPGATAEDPEFYACQAKPLAAVFDVDGVVLAGDAAVPGARDAVEAARKAGVAVVFNADRSIEQEAATRGAIRSAGLGEAEPGSTLWLRSDVGSSGKDARRLEIAKRYCVIAQVGNDLGDFADLLTQRGDAAVSPQIAQLWGAGWFMLPKLPPTMTAPAPVEEKK
jgi:hypothetical protein